MFHDVDKEPEGVLLVHEEQSDCRYPVKALQKTIEGKRGGLLSTSEVLKGHAYSIR